MPSFNQGFVPPTHAAPCSHPAYSLMLAESARLGMPTRFEADLRAHDAAFLDHFPPADPFGWILYDTGTHIVHPGGTPHKPLGGIGELLDSALECVGPSAAAYVWNGRTLNRARTGADLVCALEAARDLARGVR